MLGTLHALSKSQHERGAFDGQYTGDQFLMSEPMDMPPSERQLAVTDRRFFGHPRGLSTLFFTEMWERFSFYGLRPLLVLFMSAAILDGGFNIDRDQASAIVGIYAAS